MTTTNFDKKIQELAKKYRIPKQMLIEAIQLEKSKVVLSKRTKMTSNLIEMMGKYLAEFEKLNQNDREG